MSLLPREKGDRIAVDEVSPNPFGSTSILWVANVPHTICVVSVCCEVSDEVGCRLLFLQITFDVLDQIAAHCGDGESRDWIFQQRSIIVFGADWVDGAISKIGNEQCDR